MKEENSDDNNPLSRLSSIAEFLEGLGFIGREKRTLWNSKKDWQSLVTKIDELGEIVTIHSRTDPIQEPLYIIDLKYCIVIGNASSVAGNYELASEFYNKGIQICQEDADLKETLGYLNSQLSLALTSNEEHIEAAIIAKRAEKIRKNVLAEKEAARVERERKIAEKEADALHKKRLAREKKKARVERERKIAEKKVVRKAIPYSSIKRKWSILSEESAESVDTVSDIYSGTKILLTIVILGSLLALLSSDLKNYQAFNVFCSAIFAYISLVYFFHMWKNISINTRLLNEIHYERYKLEISENDYLKYMEKTSKKGQYQFICPHCDQKLNISASYVGDVSCPNCEGIISIENQIILD